ncbi:MAG TPA: DUF512 domain-containing protein, partial [Thermomicrobiales bacterium]|nr:DUF512 domain-containing protein [Thermomicrobiales bacterium]
EFYLMSGQPVPGADVYDGYPQIEDGIGITRHFLEEAERYLRRARAGSLRGVAGTVACGTLIAPTMRETVARFNVRTGARLDVVAVENQYLGPEITVSGLLTGADLLQAFENRPIEGPLFVSSRMLSDRTGTLLDDKTVDEVSNELGCAVVPAQSLSDIARELRRSRSRRQAA